MLLYTYIYIERNIVSPSLSLLPQFYPKITDYFEEERAY